MTFALQQFASTKMTEMAVKARICVGFRRKMPIAVLCECQLLYKQTSQCVDLHRGHRYECHVL